MFRRRAAGEHMNDIAESFGMSPNTLSKDFTRAYRAYLKAVNVEADVWRQFQTDRYEQLLAAVWSDATSGDIRANEQARKLVADLSELNGWKAPVRTEVTGADGGPLALSSASPEDLVSLIEATSRLDQADPRNSATSTADDEDGTEEASTG
ncbi:hypothetical protein HY68_36995 [Streptomyces sp. AcH 505]|uniref:hypothetical protein n=1 Tax=Streptomyces sp. AcH 505 TaxID=352211 RepID=UPI00059211F5|nr:hypothetical protein HY68_36995 [Streptomyces sp. AcH 505]